MFGKLTLHDLPHEWFTIGGSAAFILGGLGVAALITYFKRWKWLWNVWLTSCDPKKIGLMYIIVALFMLLRGGLDALMIWLQQALGSSNVPGMLESEHGYLSAHHFQQVFTAHGDIMVFFVTMGLLFGLINLIVPLQIGARDLAFPFLNSLGFWLYVAGVVMINMFFLVGGEFGATGWLAVSPLSELQFSPGVGVDYWIWSLQISGLGTLIGGINFVVTILKMRAPGMKLMHMPAFTWTSLFSMLLVITIFPILAITIALLTMDRFFGMHFFTSSYGGNPMMYWNLIWMWGHPEVYVLILPSFGIYSEIVSTFSQKKLWGYPSLIAAAGAITFLSFTVWLHHFFTMGAGADVNAFFGIMTMLIAVPTGLQIINWVMTMYRGRIIYSSMMYWFFGFVSTFTFGGMAGLVLAAPAADFQLHNSLFLVAHFHTMIVGGALFGIFAGITYWWPKVMGFKLHEKLGKIAFWFWLIGFFVAFTPLYILGFMGATRRLDHYDAATGWQPLFITAGIGLIIIMMGAAIQVLQVIVSVIQRKENLDKTGDPWNARTLEWATASPPPFYNFAIVPEVHSREPFWEMKKSPQPPLSRGRTSLLDKGGAGHGGGFKPIEMPKNTGMAIYLSACVFIFGFAMVWHIHWLAIISLLGAIACGVIRSFNENNEYEIPAEEIEKMEKDPSKYSFLTYQGYKYNK